MRHPPAPGVIVCDGFPVVGTLPLQRDTFTADEVVSTITSHMTELYRGMGEHGTQWYKAMGFRSTKLEPRFQYYHSETRGHTWSSGHREECWYVNSGTTDLAGPGYPVVTVNGKQMVDIGGGWGRPGDGWLIGPVWHNDRYAGQQAIFAEALGWDKDADLMAYSQPIARFKLTKRREFWSALHMASILPD